MVEMANFDNFDKFRQFGHFLYIFDNFNKKSDSFYLFVDNFDNSLILNIFLKKYKFLQKFESLNERKCESVWKCKRVNSEIDFCTERADLRAVGAKVALHTPDHPPLRKPLHFLLSL